MLQAQRRRREPRETERAKSARRPRRRRQSTPWLKRNALSVAAISVLIAFLGLGFGLLQMLNRPETGQLTLAQADLAVTTPATTAMSASAASGVGFGSPPQVGSAGDTSASSGSADPTRAIQYNAKVLDANYTIAAGDTLVTIAQRFKTTVARIQAFNNLSDPRALRIGTKLVIPPPL